MVVLPTDRERMLRQLRNLDEKVRAAAAVRAQESGPGSQPNPIAAKIANAQAARLADRTQELYARQPETQAAYIASILNRGGANAADFADSSGFTDYEVIRRAMGEGVNPSTVQPQDLVSRIAALSDNQRREVVGAQAAMEPDGLAERIYKQELRLNQALAERSGARAGLYGAISAGGAMGLTAAGQGVAALTQYMQSGVQQMEERQAPLTS